MRRPVLIVALAAGAALALLVAPVLAGGSPDAGKRVFATSCGGCHSIGKGDLVGPDLKDVPSRRDPAWLAQFIADPEKLFAAKDPDATALLEKYKGVRMPALGLTETQVADVVAYLQSLSGEAPPTTTEPMPTEPVLAPAPGEGDAAAGKSLFTGASRLANGGPPCLSCHTIAGIGRLGGGTLGPDLTRSYTKYGGEAGVAGVLETLPFPTMTPLFAGKQLTAEERTDLAAFLREAATAKRDSTAVWELLALGGAGVALLVALALLLWPRRALSVRKALLRTRRGT
ncbi:MAG: c-type cytochrome [Actinobacteria bacterium]|nr:c-type cytochrome [Actinomycetota bacterium]